MWKNIANKKAYISSSRYDYHLFTGLVFVYLLYPGRTACRPIHFTEILKYLFRHCPGLVLLEGLLFWTKYIHLDIGPFILHQIWDQPLKLKLKLDEVETFAISQIFWPFAKVYSYRRNCTRWGRTQNID